MNKEKLKQLLKTVNSESGVEWDSFEIEDREFIFKVVDEYKDADWEGSGKYQNRIVVYQLQEVLNRDYKNPIKLDLYVKEVGTRSGSYFTYYENDFEFTIVDKVVTHIPEEVKIIPAYDKVEYVKTDCEI